MTLLVISVIAAWHVIEPTNVHASDTVPVMSLSVGESLVEMKNRFIRLEIDKKEGTILKIIYAGENLIGGRRGRLHAVL